MKLQRVIVYVADPIKCASFYRDHLKLKTIGHWTSDWAELEADGCNLGFHQAFNDHGPIKTPTGSPLNPHKLSFFVADVAAARTKLIAAGVSMGELKDFDGWLMCNGTDAEGHTFQLTNK